MTMLAAATATVFAFADFTESGTSFENYPTNILLTTKDDSGSNLGYQYWYSAANPEEAPFVITNYASSGVAVPELKEGVGRPEKFKDVANDAFLMIETTDDKRLFRTAESNTQDPAAFTQVDIPENGIYLDTLVKFTAADSDFSADLTEGDKIAISYVEHEADTDGDESYTNFVIRAGYVDGYETQTNYCAAVPEGFDKDAWHRLTVRTIADVGDGSAGFIVYLDQVALAYSTDVAAGESAYVEALSEGIKSKFYNSEVHALFPSVVRSGAYKTSISAVSFSGNGSVDDVVFTTTTPGFIEATESVVATINLGPGISGVTVSVSGTPVEPADSAANPLVFNLAPGTTDFTLAVTADTANGYTFDDATGITAENASYANGTVSISGGAPTLTVVGKRDNAYYMDGETKVGFDTLSEAISSAPANATIKLGYNYSVTKDVVSDDAPVFVIAKNVVLDLNGKELDGGSGNARALFSVNLGCVLTVIDSVPGDGGSIIYGGTFGMFAGDGDTIIGSDADYGPVIIGAAIGDGGYISEIVRGKFSAAENTTADDEFVCGTDDDTAGIYVIADDSTFSRVGDYWVVEPQGGGDEDWKDPSEITKDATAGEVYGITGELAAADAVELTKWATGEGKVNFADKDTIKVDCFLLNIPNDSTAEQIQDEKDAFLVNISFDSNGDPVISAPNGKTYNGKLIIKGSDDLSIPKANWDEQTDGDTFFYGVLSL